MRQEYRAVVDSGLVLQIDAPDLPWSGCSCSRTCPMQRVRFSKTHVAAINLALEGIPRDRVRLHICWGTRGPARARHRARSAAAGALSRRRSAGCRSRWPIHGTNTRCGAPTEQPAPEFVLLPGVIDSTRSLSSIPEVVAQRIELAGRRRRAPERVIASSDCRLRHLPFFWWGNGSARWWRGAKFRSVRHRCFRFGAAFRFGGGFGVRVSAAVRGRGPGRGVFASSDPSPASRRMDTRSVGTRLGASLLREGCGQLG